MVTPSSPEFQKKPQSANQEFVIPLNSDEFMPPISRWATLGGVFLLGGIVIAVGIAAVTPFPVVVRSPAVVRPNGEVKIIQAAAEGTINKLDVAENQKVKQGQVIALIDDSRLQTRKRQLESSIQQSYLQIQQLEAQRVNLNSQIAAEQNLMNRTTASAQSELVRIEREYGDKKAIAQREVEEAQANVAATQAEFTAFERAGKEGAIAMVQVESKRQNYIAAKARLERAKTSLNPTSATIAIAQQQIAQAEARGKSTLATLQKDREALGQQKVQLQTQIDQESKELKQTSDDLQDTVIRAQVNGTILKLGLRNPGQVVRPGDTIAQIAPENTTLVIKARVSPQDIGTVRVEQRVNMRVSAYTYTDYGTLAGKVIAIAADAITEQNPNPAATTAPYFEVSIIPEKNYLIKSDRQYTILPGMEIQADIISQEETILTFILRKARLLVGV
ncbi:HlyD family efflux transporter periplasmic adaptor subunit [Calothrix sp. FACHB-1219]|uniref:HlyD family efflux transporter periplasmic adaptor subunit n=1 Tax=unclassified Calothrix TaxID=2619626 RepID=UPI0016876EC8|nr:MULTISPECIES: HlyD family efflux transporter periplasmic adaptor subunit [unclassified Calothrix]MBD2202514.1 HlyD family efflux transporter periplasmic adaptor subunit [Calothrix sp. FACHB-168]MBD2217895.1 HlyD family efflux transporter periplasmic adaptor subunit [Calothrix sp. FACHB-1219]